MPGGISLKGFFFGREGKKKGPQLRKERGATMGACGVQLKGATKWGGGRYLSKRVQSNETYPKGRERKFWKTRPGKENHFHSTGRR